MLLPAVVLIALLIRAEEPVCRLQDKEELPELSKHEEGIIGGLCRFHIGLDCEPCTFEIIPVPPTKKHLNFRELRFAQTMIFAIEEINKNTEILPEVSLGYMIYNSCGDMNILRALMALMNRLEETSNNRSCSKPVQVIIDHSGFTPATGLARITGWFQIPVISHFATCACLSNRKEFPSFFRTIPSDYYQSKALAQLVKHFGWTWVGAVSGDSDYGNSGMATFVQAVQEEGVCVEYSEAFLRTGPHHKLLRIVNIIKHSTSKVIVAFMSHIEINVLVEKKLRQNRTGNKTGVMESPGANDGNYKILTGMINFAVSKILQDSTSSFRSQFLRESWGTVLNHPLTTHSVVHEKKMTCIESEHLRDMDDQSTEVPERSHYKRVHNALNSVVNEQCCLCECKDAHAPLVSEDCINKTNTKPWQVLHYLWIVNFIAENGERVFFNSSRDPPAIYELINLQRNVDDSTELVNVIYHDTSLPKGQQCIINNVNIICGGDWDKVVAYLCMIKINYMNISLRNTNASMSLSSSFTDLKVPVSVCSLPGTGNDVQRGKPDCCSHCMPCTESLTADSIDCMKCAFEYWSNENGAELILKETEFLSIGELIGILFMLFLLTGACLTVGTGIIFYCYRETPLTTTNNSELSFLLLLSLTLCFLCSLTFIGQPSDWSCMLRHTAFGITFVLCVSCVLGKTIVVLMAFRATLPGNNIMKRFGPKQQKLSVLAFTLIQALICTVWLILSSPFTKQNMKYYKDRIILDCELGSAGAFCAVLGYIGFLSAMCFVLAFLAWKLPDNFNEAKFITFSMLIFCAVWITFIPAYITLSRKFRVAVEIFAILASGSGLFIFTFVPKYYIISLQTVKNFKKIT